METETLIKSFLIFVAIVILAVIADRYKAKKIKSRIKKQFPHWNLLPTIKWEGFFDAIKLADGDAENLIDKHSRYALFPEKEFVPIGDVQKMYLYIADGEQWFWFEYTKHFQNGSPVKKKLLKT